MAGAIRVRDLSFAYRQREVLNKIALDVSKGELIMILGPNGCGKTTLLKCLLGLLSYRGTVWVLSQELSRLSTLAKAKISAYVPQNHFQVFPYRVLDVVTSARAAFYGLSGPRAVDRRIAWESLKTVGMEAYANRSYTELSGGELKLVLLARALAQHSPVLFLDEPTSNLDIKNRLLTLEILQTLARDGKTILTTEHDPNLAAHFATRLLMLRDGEIVAYGPPEHTVTEDILRRVYDVDVEVIRIKGRIHICPTRLCRN